MTAGMTHPFEIDRRADKFDETPDIGGDGDLEDPARELCPAIDPVLSALDSQAECLLARMSGSGATCFGLFATAPAAMAAARRIAEEQPSWWVVAAPLLSAADEVAISPIDAYM